MRKEVVLTPPAETWRAAGDADYPAFVRLFRELGVADPTPTREAFAAMRATMLVGEKRGQVVAYGYYILYGATAHIVHVAVAPEARGHGLGRALMDRLKTRVQAGGAVRWFLNVKQDNASAIRLYQRCGLKVALDSWAMRFAWSGVAALPADERQLPATTPIPADDEAFARLTQQPKERIGAVRARGRVLASVHDDGRPVAFASFDPGYPGVYPVAVARPGLERTLFEALRPHADPAHGDLLRVTVDADRALADRLVAAGAVIEHPIHRMTGSLM
ncbi:MAG: GNAT family N-acetyltransferase [Myxococcota bacterium]